MSSFKQIFVGKNLKFYGFSPQFESELKTIVEKYGASKWNDDPIFSFVNVENYHSVPAGAKMYDAAFILHSIQAEKCLEIEHYRFEAPGNCSEIHSECNAAKYVLRTENCASFYFDNICQKCKKHSAANKVNKITCSDGSVSDETKIVNGYNVISNQNGNQNQSKVTKKNDANTDTVLDRNPFYGASTSNTFQTSQKQRNDIPVDIGTQCLSDKVVEMEIDTSEDEQRHVKNTSPERTQRRMSISDSSSSGHERPSSLISLKALKCKRHNCKVSPHVHNAHSEPLRNFSHWEDIFIIKYLVKIHSISRAKGLDVYVAMRNEGYMQHRTPQSMNNRMRKYILPNIKLYKLSKVIECQFRLLKK